MDHVLIGEIAALATSALWALSSTFFVLGGKGHSPQTVNRIRLVGALVLLGISHVLLLGYILPVESLYVWLVLGLSGVIGLSLGDGFLFWAFKKVGPRVTMLVMSMTPIVTTSAAWILMGETISFLQIIAIGITISGVSLVVTERKEDRSPFRITLLGLFLAVAGMLGQAVQILLAKDAMGRMASSNPALTATFIRIMWGAGALWIASAFSGSVRRSIKAVRSGRFVLFVGLATVVGPFLGIWISFVAIRNVEIGIASTLMSLSPLILIPISWRVFHERITVRVILGTLVALAGVAGIFLL